MLEIRRGQAGGRVLRHHLRGWSLLIACLTLVAPGRLVMTGAQDLPEPNRSPDTVRARDEYLKRTGETWQRVQRTADGRLRLIVGSAPAASELAGLSSLASSAPTNGSLFQPYVAIPTGSWPEAVAIGDVNGDGLNDVVMVTSFYFDPTNDYMLHVWIQQPDGTLAPRVRYPLGGSPKSVAIGDVNGDGLNDVVVGIGTGVGVLTQSGDGTLNPMVLHPTNDALRVRVADLNGDGRLDIVSLGWGTNTVTVFTQQVDGTLAAPVVYSAPHGGYDDLDVADMNNDGLTDVIVMSGQSLLPNISILYQQPDGTLGNLTSLNVTTPHQNTAGIGVGDINGDGLNDIVASYGGNRPGSFLASFLQDSNGGMQPPVPYESLDIPEPVRVADIDGDGRLDVVVAHGGWVKLGVYLQGQDGTLMPEQLFPIPYASHYNPHGLAVGDINGDGANDVVLADYNNGLVILYGTSSKR